MSKSFQFHRILSQEASSHEQEAAHARTPFNAVQSLQALTYSVLTHVSRHSLRSRHAPCPERVRAGSCLYAPSLPFVGPVLSVKGRQKRKSPQLKGANMRTLTCSQMKSAIERILRSHELLEDFQRNSEFAVRIKNGPYLPLTIERHESRITITHYFVQNGDLVPDPDMELEQLADGSWYPVAIQFATGHYRRAMEIREGKRFVNPREIREQVQFSRIWARNLIDQGFESGEAERID